MGPNKGGGVASTYMYYELLYNVSIVRLTCIKSFYDAM